MRPVLAGLALLTSLACSPRPEPPRFRLVEKGKYQALYGAQGRLLRVLEDGNGDGVADAVVVCGADGKPQRGEVDTDLDGKVDRVEILGPEASPERVGTIPDQTDSSRLQPRP